MRQDVRDFMHKNYGAPTAPQCDNCGLYIGKLTICDVCGDRVCADCTPHCPKCWELPHNCLDHLTTMGEELVCRLCVMRPLIKETQKKGESNQ